jgi:hypothetical protein
MKNPMMVGGLMLALGFALGWVAKPAATDKGGASTSQSSVSNSSADASVKEVPSAPLETKRAERPATPPKPKDALTDEQRAQAKKMQAEASKMMIRNFRAKFEQHIEKLTAGVDLTPEQTAALTSWLEERMAKLENVDFTKPDTMKDLDGLMKSLTTKALEEQLAPTLSDDQKTSLAEFKDKERKSKADAGALKNLSMMQGVVEFKEGQRDEVYKLLAEDAEARAREEEENPDVSKSFTEGMGIQMDPYDLGLQKAMTDAAGMDGSKMAKDPNGQKEMAKQLRTVIDKRIDERVEKLRPVLDDHQLDQYRTELKTKGLGIYGSMLMGMEKAGE